MPAQVWGAPTTAMWVYRLGVEKAKRMLFNGNFVLDAVAARELDVAVEAMAGRMVSVPLNQLAMQKMVINQAIEACGLTSTQRRASPFRRQYGAVRVPPMVHAELAIDTAKPGAKVLADAFAAEWITVKAVGDADAVLSSSRLLDPGESEAIVLAEQETARFLLIDDARGRRIARGRGIPVVGVAGVLLNARSRGALAEVRPALDALSQVGYRLFPRLVTAVLERAGE